MISTSRQADIPADWLELFTHLPGGYCPVRTASDGHWFDPAAAERICRFFETQLVHVKGEYAGKPMLLRPWQRAVLGCLFGWKRESGRRRFSECMLYLPRKNGKSILAAGVGLYTLLADGEAGAEVYVAATTRDQASILWKMAREMVRRNRALSSRTTVRAAYKQIASSDGEFRAVAAEAGTIHGTNPSVVLVDELHAHPTGDLVEALATGQGARAQPLFITLTTADFDRESICNTKARYARRVRDGDVDDPTYLPVMFESALDDDIHDPDTWARANPNLGVSIDRDWFEREAKRAQDEPAFENSFRRLHLNQTTQQDVRWLSLQRWDEAGDADPLRWRADQLQRLEGRMCYGGLDLSAVSDLTTLVLVFPEDDDTYTLLPWIWAPRAGVEKAERRAGVPFRQWERQGFLTITEGDEIDYRQVRNDVNSITGAFRLEELAADRMFQGAQLVHQLREDDGLPVIAFGQGYASMAAPVDAFGKAVTRRQIQHGGNPVLRWQIGNVQLKIDPAGNAKLDRSKSTSKIDTVVASVMALARAHAARGMSSLERRGGMVILG